MNFTLSGGARTPRSDLNGACLLDGVHGKT
jgi:hypothetical protein